MYGKNSRPVYIIDSTEISSCREDCSWSSRQNYAWGIDINNGCCQGKLLDYQITTSNEESNQKLF